VMWYIKKRPITLVKGLMGHVTTLKNAQIILPMPLESKPGGDGLAC
jgi:hypothetical protein